MSARRGWSLALVCITTFMLVLDITIVAVAMPDIQQSLDADLAGLQWVIDAYTLMLAVLLLTAATLGDRWGRKRLFQIGTAVFTAGSLACGLAPTVRALDVYRGVQGAGAALLFGLGLPLIADAYPAGRQRNIALGIYGAVTGTAVAVGPLAGGALIDASSWRSIFFVNVPIGLFVLVAAALRLTAVSQRRPGRVDWLGTIVLTAALFALVLACIRGNSYGWGSPRILTLLVVAGVLLALFLVVEHRHPDPMLDFSLFTSTTYSANAFVAYVTQGALVAPASFVALYLQNVLGFTPLGTGLRFLPLSLAAFAAALPAAMLLGRVPTAVLVGLTGTLAALGLELMAHLDAASGWTALVPGMLVAGVALGMASTVLNQVALTGVEPNRSGMASGAVMALKQVGVATGVAVLGAVYQHTITGQAAAGLSARGIDSPGLATALADGAGVHAGDGLPPAAGQVVVQVARDSTTAGLDNLMHLAALACLAAAIVGVAGVRSVARLREPQPEDRVPVEIS